MEKRVEQLTKTLESVLSCLANNTGRKEYVATIFHHVYDDPIDEDYYHLDLDDLGTVEVKFLLDKRWCLIDNKIFEVRDGNGVPMSLEDLKRFVTKDEEELQKDIEWLIEHGMLTKL